MPTYEYLCDRCGERLEVFQSFQARPLKRHASCGGSLSKVFHPRGVVFKGSGFYATDSRSKPAGEKADQVSNGGSSSGIAADKSAVSTGSSDASD
jgi:putative FmdB family regulatory protein